MKGLHAQAVRPAKASRRFLIGIDTASRRQRSAISFKTLHINPLRLSPFNS